MPSFNRPLAWLRRFARDLWLEAALLVAVAVTMLSIAGCPTSVMGQQPGDPTYDTYMELPAEYRAWFKNPDGSCVQCSNGMTGMHNNCPPWTYLLWETEYGPAERRGSWPSRVADYARRRGVKIWNVTGSRYEDTRPWMIWAARTNRFCAIGAGGRHFQTLYGYVPSDAKPWKVCNNNSTSKIDEYTEAGFRSLHMASGPWVVILDAPPPAAPPRLVPWWQ